MSLQCDVCQKELTTKSLTCRSCKAKAIWAASPDRRSALSDRLKQSNPSVGRPKGSKNKNPYPLDARQSRSEYWTGREQPHNRDQDKIKRCKSTWAAKSDTDIKVMIEKQTATRISNGTRMSRHHQGKFTPRNPDKYMGDAANIVFRSGWELAVLKWFDANPDVVNYSSEEVVIPYYFPITKRSHRYFVDFRYTTKTGQTFLIEVKPAKETTKPKKVEKSPRYIRESVTYIRNQCKWEAATKFAEMNGWVFQVWTEVELVKLGIMPKPLKPLKKIAPLKPLRKPTSRK